MLRCTKSTRLMHREGFTLVELLIVIVVIGVLSAMMMLSSTEAVSSAKASNIVSNLRNLKTAVLSWYADNLDRVKYESNGYKVKDANGTSMLLSKFVDTPEGKTEILKYINGDSSIPLKGAANSTAGDYILRGAGTDNTKWYIYYDLKGDKNLKDKLKSRAQSIGLIGGANTEGQNVDQYTNQDYVGMLVLDMNN